LFVIQSLFSQPADSVVDKDLSFKAKDRLDHGVRENIKLRKSNSTVAQVHCNRHFIKQCQRLKTIKAVKLTVAWSLNCMPSCYSVCVPGE